MANWQVFFLPPSYTKAKTTHGSYHGVEKILGITEPTAASAAGRAVL